MAPPRLHAETARHAEFSSQRSRIAVAAIGAVLLVCGIVLLVLAFYLHYSGGEVRVSEHRYLRLHLNAPFVLLAGACASTLLGAAAMLWARPDRRD